MAEEKQHHASNFGLIAIVGIVAIVGLIVLFAGGGTKETVVGKGSGDVKAEALTSFRDCNWKVTNVFIPCIQRGINYDGCNSYDLNRDGVVNMDDVDEYLSWPECSEIT